MKTSSFHNLCLTTATILPLQGWLKAQTTPPLFETDVLPILTKNCMGCHGGLKQKGELDLRTLPSILKGGESGASILS